MFRLFFWSEKKIYQLIILLLLFFFHSLFAQPAFSLRGKDCNRMTKSECLNLISMENAIAESFSKYSQSDWGFVTCETSDERQFECTHSLFQLMKFRLNLDVIITETKSVERLQRDIFFNCSMVWHFCTGDTKII